MTTSNRFATVWIAGLLIAAMAATADAAIIAGELNDAQVQSTGAGSQGSGLSVINSGSTSIRSGRFDSGAGLNLVSVFVFQLPSLGSKSFAAGTLTFQLNSVQSSPTYGVDLYGIDARATASVITSDFYFGSATDPTANATKLQDSILTPSTGTGSIVSVDISGWLDDQYDGGAGAGQYVFLRLSPDGNSGIFDVANGYNVTTANAGSGQPFLSVTIVPEPSSAALLGLGLVGAAIWRRRRIGRRMLHHRGTRCVAPAVLALLCLYPAANAHATLMVLDDDFDNGVLATNPTGVGGGFQEVDNGVGSGGTATESGGTVTISDGNDNNNHGIVSTAGFIFSGGVVATWDAASYNFNGAGIRRLQFALQSGTAFNVSNTRSILFTIDTVDDSFVMRLDDGDHSPESFSATGMGNIIVSDANGFTLTAVFSPLGFLVSTSGLNAGADGSIVGTFPTTNGITFADLFGGVMHSAAYIQSTGSTTSTLVLNQVTLTAVPEPSSAALLGFGLLGAAVCRGRRN